MFRCVFYSLIGNNVSRIDNLEEIILILFHQDLKNKYEDRKKFSFQAICKEIPKANISIKMQSLLDNNRGFKNIQSLRNQIAHASIEDILDHDPLLYDEDVFFVNPAFTLSETKEDIIKFSENINGLLKKIEDEIFNCLISYGKNCLKEGQ